MENFWIKLKKPFIVLAPMAEITDIAMRQMLVKYGKPDVLYTEFVSAEVLAAETAAPLRTVARICQVLFGAHVGGKALWCG